MPPIRADRPILHVEGRDDDEVLRRLLCYRGIFGAAAKLTGLKPDLIPVEVRPCSGWTGVLDSIPDAVAASSDRSLGFVLDANGDPLQRWVDVCEKLNAAGVSASGPLLPDGFRWESPDGKRRVGVWLMPDNLRAGALEEFLYTLIPEADPLFPYAKSATGTARSNGAQFKPVHTNKAELLAWLAWQNPPNRFYGTAVVEKAFRHEGPLLERFSNWFSYIFQQSISDYLHSIEIKSRRNA